MSYKVFFVEDEIVTREGIRDNVDWNACGFEFCGEAADGEVALPLIRAARPDVLITDIKMPFMDGLQLSKIVREYMPWIKIMILSGHDEFEYAQEAINLGVTEYLLKPVTVQKLHDALRKLAVTLDQESKEQANLRTLQAQVEENRATLRERLLLKLVVGAVSPVEAVEKGSLLGLDLIARCYQVIILKFELRDRTETFDYSEYQRVQRLVSELGANNPDLFLLEKDLEDMLLVMKGSTPEYLEEERDQILQKIRQAIAATRYQVSAGIGSIQKRIADIRQSFLEALLSLQNPVKGQKYPEPLAIERAELLKVDKQAVENYLRSGQKEEFELFFNAYLRPLSTATLQSPIIKNYIFLDLILAASKLMNELGGQIEQVMPDLGTIETILANIKTVEGLRQEAETILSSTLDFRDRQSGDQYIHLIHQARQFIEQQYANPELSLNDVAAQVNLSASHFSVVFSQQCRQTFKEYLTEIRIQKAKELLRMTSLRSADIADRVGYNDPHYFSSVFKKQTGLSPIEFRSKYHGQKRRAD